MALTNLNAAVAWTQQSVDTAQVGRFHAGAQVPLAAATTGMTAWRDGVVCHTNQGGLNNIPNDLQIKQAGSPSLSITCEAGSCIITRSGQGPFLCYLQTQGTLTVANADPTNPRIDRIVAQIYDTTIGDSLAGLSPLPASPGCLVIRAVTGTPAGSPAAPATPAGAISLATVAVAANATQILTANITDTRKSILTPSGARTMLPGDLVTDAGAVSGELRYQPNTSDTGASVWNGATWVPLGIPVFTTNATRDTAITLPFTNQMAWTNDTNTLWRWGGSSWVTVKASGFVGLVQGSANLTITAEVLIDSGISFTAYQNHKYRCTFISQHTNAGATTNPTLTLKWRQAAGGTVTTAGTEFGRTLSTVAVTGQHNEVTSQRVLSWSSATAAITVGIFGASGGTGSFLDSQTGVAREILIEDMT